MKRMKGMKGMKRMKGVRERFHSSFSSLSSPSSLLRSNKGIAAMEFALCAPALILVGLGGYDMARWMLIQQKAEKVAYAVADVVAQGGTVSVAQINQTLTAASQIMQPYAFGANGVVIISSVAKTGNNAPTVRWRQSGGGTMAASSQIGGVGGNATLPGGLTLADKDNVIVAEVYYKFTPLLTGIMLGSSNLYKTAVFKPRLGALTTPPT